MTISKKKAWLAAVGLALAVSSAGGAAVAAGAVGSHALAAASDPDRTGVALKLYNASGTEVTSGSTTGPIAAFAAAAGTVREGDAYATLYVHLARSGTAPGAWPGLQVTGTDKFSGAGAVPAPASLNGKPYVATTADGYSLADVAAAFPSTETKAGFAGVYELRLRTSSPADGVSTAYAATWVKVTGSTWTITDAPPVEETGVGTSVAAGWPAKATYGKATKVAVQVTATSGSASPTGTVRVVQGSTTLGTAQLANGAATVTIGKKALTPGKVQVRVVYDGAASAFASSESDPRTLTVAKAAPGQPTLKVTKLPTTATAGKATVAVPTPAGLAKAGGKATVVLTKDAATQKVAVKVKAGKATVKLPKLARGTWSVVVAFGGDAHYKAAKSKAYKVKV
jgi:hypothetical protein